MEEKLRLSLKELAGGDDGARTRDLLRDNSKGGDSDDEEH
jgi:hypothetical protein